jgi:hypothetical protein
MLLNRFTDLFTNHSTKTSVILQKIPGPVLQYWRTLVTWRHISTTLRNTHVFHPRLFHAFRARRLLLKRSKKAYISRKFTPVYKACSQAVLRNSISDFVVEYVVFIDCEANRVKSDKNATPWTFRKSLTPRTEAVSITQICKKWGYGNSLFLKGPPYRRGLSLAPPPRQLPHSQPPNSPDYSDRWRRRPVESP